MKLHQDTDIESDLDEITQESSPNSVQAYSNFGSQKDNVLVCNKGQVKNISEFKTELDNIIKTGRVTNPSTQ